MSEHADGDNPKKYRPKGQINTKSCENSVPIGQLYVIDGPHGRGTRSAGAVRGRA
jgi:hypothetical protein